MGKSAPELGAMRHVRAPDGEAVEEGDDRRRATGQTADGRAIIHAQDRADQAAPRRDDPSAR
jgi:hypothetical protein